MEFGVEGIEVKEAVEALMDSLGGVGPEGFGKGREEAGFRAGKVEAAEGGDGPPVEAGAEVMGLGGRLGGGMAAGPMPEGNSVAERGQAEGECPAEVEDDAAGCRGDDGATFCGERISAADDETGEGGGEEGESGDLGAEFDEGLRSQRRQRGQGAKGGFGFGAGFVQGEGDGAAAEVPDEDCGGEGAEDAGFHDELDVVILRVKEGEVAAEVFEVFKGLLKGAPAGAQQREVGEDGEGLFPQGQFGIAIEEVGVGVGKPGEEFVAVGEQEGADDEDGHAEEDDAGATAGAAAEEGAPDQQAGDEGARSAAGTGKADEKDGKGDAGDDESAVGPAALVG